MKKIILISVFVSVFSVICLSKENNTQNNVFTDKILVMDKKWFDVNRMNGVFQNNGIWYFDASAGDWGLEWPKGSGLSPVFAAGQWIGARVEGQVRIAGVQHGGTDFQPGMILEPFIADNPNNETYRLYSIESDGRGDWLDWPVDQGAPVDDIGNPLLLGDRTLYCVWNDLFENMQFGTQPLSIEIHQTVFAFDRADELGDMQFIKWLLINKSDMVWDSTYFSIFIDSDIGAAGDDLVGCDTTLNLGFCYNATNNDQTYGPAPPAIGVDLLQGPIVYNSESKVTLSKQTLSGGREMLPMTSFIYYNNDDTPQGNPQSGTGAWNYMRGRWRDGTPITEGEKGSNPANPRTMFVFPGNPETATGWLDYEENDRRFLMTTGPFTMAAWNDVNTNSQPDIGEPGVQEITICVFVGRGTNHLNSVTKVKQMDAIAQSFYDANFLTDKPSDPITFPQSCELNQNYPNPFNSSTLVGYHLEIASNVDLSIYNVLGKKVTTLVSERQQAGQYQVKWDASDFASGIYLYQLRTNNGFIQSKKLLLLK